MWCTTAVDPMNFESKQEVLRELSKRGMPVVGITRLQPDTERYAFERIENISEKFEVVYRWKRRS